MSTANGDAPKKIGRPPKPPNSLRSVEKRICLTVDEDARIRRDAEALGLTQADLIRTGALNYRRLTAFAATVRAEMSEE